VTALFKGGNGVACERSMTPSGHADAIPGRGLNGLVGSITAIDASPTELPSSMRQATTAAKLCLRAGKSDPFPRVGAVN
jgi:hypothetical protein